LPQITLKIDVDTLRGTREGVPNLVTTLQRHQANATFLFSLGPDHTGWALRRALRPGFFQKVSRTSVLEHYGLKTLMYGVLVPAPDIGNQCQAIMRGVADAGFECGIHTWDHVVWQDTVRHRDESWTVQTMQRAWERFKEIFGTAPTTHGAAGWQMNRASCQQLDRFGLSYASDSRACLNPDGSLINVSAGPYRQIDQHQKSSCIQLPTTLPTLDEVLGRTINGELLTPLNIASFLLKLTAAPRDHVYTLHAELEGQKLAPVFEALLAGWKAQGYTLGSMAQYYEQTQTANVPSAEFSFGSVPGRSGELLIQPVT
jgi:undecaprenyl phosphate-alpha-L-ara4FN deformylase